MDSISTILHGRAKKDEPEEITRIKSFILREYDETCQVTVRRSDIIITVVDGTIANLIQLRIDELQQICQTDKRLRVNSGLRSQ